MHVRKFEVIISIIISQGTLSQKSFFTNLKTQWTTQYNNNINIVVVIVKNIATIYYARSTY